jgi:hypothetical protein
VAVTITSFRQVFRAFNDLGKFPDDAIAYYTALGVNFLSGAASGAGHRFDALILDHAVGLFVAHHLVLDARDADVTAITGAIPGELEGVATAKSADKVSINMDTKAVTFENEGFWNMTRFGVQLMNLARMFGAGGIQLGTPGGDVDLLGWG